MLQGLKKKSRIKKSIQFVIVYMIFVYVVYYLATAII